MRRHVRDRKGLVHAVKNTDTVPLTDGGYTYRFVYAGEGRTAAMRGPSYLVVCGAWVRPSYVNWDKHAVTCMACIAGGE